MTLQQVMSSTPYVIGALFALALVLFLLALIQLRRSRKGAYWRLRRQAGQSGAKLLLSALALFALAAALTFYSGLAAIAFRGLFATQPEQVYQGVVVPTWTPTSPLLMTASHTPTFTATATDTLVPSATATATPSRTRTATRTPTPTFTPTVTNTPTPTFTLSPTFEQILKLTQPALVTMRQPGESVLLAITAADQTLSLDHTPVEPKTTFGIGVKRIYLFFAFENMNNGVRWSRVLYREGVAVQGQTYLWGMGESGDSFFFFGNDEGYASGDYQIRLFVGSDEVSRFNFSIL
jgi:hypothetical protein